MDQITPERVSSDQFPDRAKRITHCINEKNSVVAIYPTHTAAEAAVKELQQSGFDMKKLSIAGRDFHTEEHVVGYYNTGDRMVSWGKTGAFWGWIWGACSEARSS